ncbi:hypothetical protein N7510_010606 [Penicillium lagena]|uniref:uncharacterized protein n=1 Tax=Penicillium lagena TaxID=94218 RepID=UPI002540ECA5|nr:uncharacterized protein N7510_010606 [Penicillium lagena]KAJ5601072.1 hypothetical protein N7510_010606 [Penicillium lagena]
MASTVETPEITLSAPEVTQSASTTSDAYNNERPPSYTSPQQPSPAALPVAQQGQPTEQMKSNVPTTMTYTQPLQVTPLTRLGETPAWIDCPHCHARTQTRVAEENSSETRTASLLCCLFCGIIGVCIPSLCGWCADTDHFCTRCGKQVARKPHDGPAHEMFPPEQRQVASKYATAQPVPQPVLQPIAEPKAQPAIEPATEPKGAPEVSTPAQVASTLPGEN